jgi:hypothetical protein
MENRMNATLEGPTATTEIVPPAVRTEIDAVSAYVSGITPHIACDRDLQDAGQVLRDISTRAKALETRRLEITRPMDAAKKSVMDLFAAPLKQLQEAEAGLKRAITGYQLEQARIREAEERRLQEKADRERREAEARAEELRQKAADCPTEGRAAYLEGLAEEQELKAAVIVAPTLAPAAKVEGVSMRDCWTAEVTDIRALCQAVCEGRIDAQALLPNMPYLSGLAKALKQGMRIPGVRAVNNPVVAARRI